MCSYGVLVCLFATRLKTETMIQRNTVTNTVWHAPWAQIGSYACNFECAKAIFGVKFVVQHSHTILIELEIDVLRLHTARERERDREIKNQLIG